MATDRHSFLTWSAGFTQSDTILNDLLLKLEVKLGLSVLSRTTTAQPGAPTAGDCYIIPSGATGAAWSTFAQHDVVIFRDSTWYSTAPISGWFSWVADDANGVMFNGSSWVSVIGANQFADDVFRIQDNSDPTKQIAFQASGITAGQTRTFIVPDSDVTFLKNNFAATTDPGVGDDDADGYAIGSWWLNITDQRLFHCENASTGAAVWLPVYGLAAVRVVSGTTDTILSTDSGKVIVFTNAAAIAVTLPDTFPLNFQFTVIQTTAAGVPTVTRSGADTINGAATGVAPSAQWKGAYFVQHAANAWIALL